jgi:hypothetical protein
LAEDGALAYGTFRTSSSGRTAALPANIGRSTNCHALVGLVDTGRRPNDVDLAALTHSPTTFVHNLGSRLRYVKWAKVGIHLG